MLICSRKSKKRSGVGCAAAGDLGEGLATQLGQSRCNRCYKSRFISLAAARDWSQEWAIGFNQETILRHLLCAGMGGFRLRERHRPTEADEETEGKESLHFVGRTTPAMHHTSGATALSMPLSELKQHRLGRIPTMNDHRQIKLHGQIQLRSEHLQLTLEIGLPEQIETEFTNGDDPGIIERGFSQHSQGVRLPMFSVQGMHSDGVAKLRETISKSSDRRDLSGLHTGMQQGSHTGLPPALCHLIKIVIEVSKNDVAVTVNQCWG